LYDIANVFSSLGLIKKTCLDSKKPAFQWVGNRGLDELIESLNGSPGKPIVSTEKSTKKNLVKNEAKVHKKEEKFCQTPVTSVSENNSALKAPATKEDKLDNFMNMILELCQQAQASSKLPYQNSFSHLFGQSNFTPNLSYQNLAFNQYAHFYQLQNNLDNTRVFQNTVPKVEYIFSHL